MQFGRSRRVLQLGQVVFFAVIAGSVSAHGQQIGDILGGGGLTQSSSGCAPTDPGCQSDFGQTNNQYNNPNYSGQGGQIPAVRGANLPGQTQNPQNDTTDAQRAQLDQQRQTRQPLDLPTEFQQMVANSTGKMLPIYGAKMFRLPPSTFAPLDMVPVTPDYLIGPGDELLIQIWGQVTLNTRIVVDRTGNVYIPQVGQVRVAGLPFAQLQEYLKGQISRVFRNFDLNVNMGQLRSIQVFVTGQAQKPGNFTVSALSTLVNALFVTGGPTPQGSLRHIELKRSGKVIADFDLYDLLLRGDKSKDVQLLPGDVIYIPPVGPQVAVAGNVNTPAIYELKSSGDSTLGEVISLAAGLTNVASQQRVKIERIDEGRMRSILEVSLDTAGKATRLQSGDILEFGAVVNQYKDAVTLRGNVANPGRYAWKSGMRVHDLFPDKESLITRDYWLKRSQLGQPMLTFIPTCSPKTPYGIPNLRYGLPAGEGNEESLWQYAAIRNPNLIGQAFRGQERKTSNDRSNGNDSSESDPANSLPTTDGGLDCEQRDEAQLPQYPTPTTSLTNPQQSLSAGNSDMTSLSRQARAPRQGSAAGASVVGSEQFLPRNDVKMLEPDIDWSYAVIERQSKENLSSSLLPFNLGKVVLQGDQSQNLMLEPGDVVTIFSTADIHVPQAQQAKYVRLEGEFASAGIYSALPGETLRQLVKRAGGITPDGYLFGSEFTRESTRLVQQQKYTEYIDQIELQASTNAANGQGRAINAQDSAAASAAQIQDQNIVNRLRQVHPTGRIVLNLSPDTRDISQIPDIPLENGDRFIVPRVPTTVSVDGAVYNQNSFLYAPQRRVGGYIRLAGGANRDSDKKRAYVIRADGSVISKQYSSTLRGNNFNSLRLYPGDTVIVPLNLNKGQGLRTLVDVAQVVGQFGIAIAAANLVF